MRSRSHAVKIALSGMAAALSVVLMMFEGLVQIASVAMPALAGCLLIPIVAEAGLGYGFGAYGATSALLLLLAPDREAALIYLLFFGYYPALYAVLCKIRNRVLRWGVKLVIFNAAAILEAWLAVYVLGIPWEELPVLGEWGPVLLLLLANLVFVLYDRALAGVITLYFQWFHGMLAKYFKR